MGAVGPVPVVGDVAPGFEPVRDAFVANFAGRGELGASVCVLHRGDVVVDLAGGWADEARTRPFGVDTLTDVYSVGKALLAVLALRATVDAAVDLDDPIASFWPEFAEGGKSSATVRHALTHTAGVPAIRRRLTDDDLFDWTTMAEAVAGTEAWWPPGDQLAYHVNTFGHLVGEIVRRVGGRSVGEALRHLADPIDADVWFGVPVELQPRCADTVWDPAFVVPEVRFEDLAGQQLLDALAHFNPPGYSSVGVVNTVRWRGSEIGSTSGHASARGVARCYQALLEPDRILPWQLLREATRVQVSGRCPILRDDVAFGLGFQPTSERRRLGPNRGAFGHFGSGGALGFADPDDDVAFGYVMNHVIPRWQSTRNRALIDAVYRSLGR